LVAPPPLAMGRLRAPMPMMQVVEEVEEVEEVVSRAAAAATATAAAREEAQAIFGPNRKKVEIAKSERIVLGMRLPPIEVEVLRADDAVVEVVEADDVVGVESWYDQGIRLSDPPAPVAEEVAAPAAVTGPVVTPINELLAKGTTVLVGMPGAFTPTCNDLHLPGYVNGLEPLLDLGVEQVAIITTNDLFVNRAWRDSLEACMGKKMGKELTFFSDADGWVLRAVGLVDDMGFGLGVRSQRFALVLKDGVVEHIAVDEAAGDAPEATSAEAIIEYLTPEPEPEPPASKVMSGLSSSSSSGGEVQPAAGVAAVLVAAVAAGVYYSTSAGLSVDELVGTIQAAGGVATAATGI